MTAGEARHINFPLMAALLFLPIVFVWVLLIPGYPASTRIAAFTYALVPPILGLIGAGLQGLLS